MPFHVDSQSILSEFRRSQAPNTSPGTVSLLLASTFTSPKGCETSTVLKSGTPVTYALAKPVTDAPAQLGQTLSFLGFEAASGAQATGRQGTEGQGHKDLGFAQGRVDTGTGDVETGTWVTLDNSYTA